jgi:hypothetical protein
MCSALGPGVVAWQKSEGGDQLDLRIASTDGVSLSYKGTAGHRPRTADTAATGRPDPLPAGGTLGYLAVISPAINRLALELTDRQATALAAAIGKTSPITPEIAHLQGIALAGVSRSSSASRAGAPAKVRLRPR